jgi:hypothetical protein
VTICQVHRPAEQVSGPFDDGTGMYIGLGAGVPRAGPVRRV